jgi:hypothetical protein
MDLVNLVKTIIARNIKLVIILFIAAIGFAVIHFKMQSPTYVSNFKTNNGFVDYSLFRSLTDFDIVNTEMYDLPEDQLNQIIERLAEFKISYIEETSTSYSFTVSSKTESKDHAAIQDDILALINNNRFIKNSQASELSVMERKLAFLKEKISQLDSLMMAPSSNTRISTIPSDSYHLYSQQLDLEEKIKDMGNFQIIKPITSIKTNKRPIVLFMGLYMVLAGFVFLLFSKKSKLEN